MEPENNNYVNLTPFSFKDGPFEQKIVEFERILLHRKNANVTQQYYGPIFQELVETDFTEEQQQKIRFAYEQKELYDDANKVVASRISRRFSFKDMETAQDGDVETIFQQKLDQIKQIATLRRFSHFSEKEYSKVKKELIRVKLTEEQEKKIKKAFKDNTLVVEGAEIIASRTIHHFDPNVEASNKKLEFALFIIQKHNLWDKRIFPKIKKLSQNHEVIVAKYNKQPTLKAHFEEMLKVLGKLHASEDAAAVVESIVVFENKFGGHHDYKNLKWESFYNLLRAKFSVLSSEERGLLLFIYLRNNSQKSNFESIKKYILNNIAVPGSTNLKMIFDDYQLTSLKTNEIQHIAELSAHLVLTSKEEYATLGLFPKDAKDSFLLERFRAYCQNIKMIKDSKFWNLEDLKAFFSDCICYNFYNYPGTEIEPETFRSIVECCFEQLNDQEIEEIKKAPYFLNYVDKDFQLCLTKAKCNKLNVLKNEDEVLKLHEEVKKDLTALVQLYATRYLDIENWMGLFYHIQDLKLDPKLYIPLLEIFRRRRDPNSMSGTVLSIFKKYYWGRKSPQAVSTWKGEKYDTFFNSLQNWAVVNDKWISDNLKESEDNSNAMIKKVKHLLDLLTKLKSEKDITSLSKDEINEYNNTRRHDYIKFIENLREAIKDPEFENAFDRYLTLESWQGSGAMLILKEMCNFRLTGMEGVPFIVNLMTELIPLGFETLAIANTEVGYLAERQLLEYTNPLRISLDLQQEAIAGLPESFKTPYLHLVGQQLKSGIDYNWDPHKNGNLPYAFLELDYVRNVNGNEETKTVTFIRSATPTGPHGINPEFKVALRNNDPSKRFLFISLQSSIDSTESSRIEELMNLRRKGIYILAYPVSGDFYMQEGEFADDALYPSWLHFEQALMDKFIAYKKKGQVTINAPGNYLVPASWLASTKFKEGLKNCMEEVRNKYFPGKQVFTAEERRIFIKYFNIKLNFYLIEFTGATTFGYLCNHSADRTGVSNALMMDQLTTIFQNKEEVIFKVGEKNFTYDDMWRGLVNGVPLVTVKRPMNNRLNELTEALGFIEDHPEVKKRLEGDKKYLNVVSMRYPEFTLKPLK